MLFNLVKRLVKPIPCFYEFTSIFFDVIAVVVHNPVLKPHHVDDAKDYLLPCANITYIKHTKRFVKSLLNFIYFFFKENYCQFHHLLSNIYSGL